MRSLRLSVKSMRAVRYSRALVRKEGSRRCLGGGISAKDGHSAHSVA